MYIYENKMKKLIIYEAFPGGAKDSADFCVRIIQQKVTSHPVEN